MCGIVGFCGIDSPNLLKSMNRALFHRGPDESGEFIDRENKVSLAMRRLSIIDIAGGHQPMSNEDGSVWIVFNGEIYNFASLRRDLTAKGHSFKSDHSDTEVLIHLYEEKGPDLLHFLNGMFAFVIYDKKNKVLFGARDRLGIKPLYYFSQNGLFLFASEIKALLLAPEVSREIDSQSLYDYLSFQFIPAPNTIFADIKKLAAAHYFLFDCRSKKLAIKRYWQLSHRPINIKKTEEAVDLLRQETERAVSDWAVSDVPIACSLSGGIDSSSIVGILSYKGISGLKTFSLGFRDRGAAQFDERAIARNTARKWGADHHEIVLEPDDLLRDLDDMIWHLDEPYGGGLPSWYVFKAMKAKVKVALTGTGGDELFGVYGYWRPYEDIFWNIREVAKYIMLDRAPLQTLGMLQRYPQGYLYHRYFTDVMKRRFVYSEKLCKNFFPSEAQIQRLWNKGNNVCARDKVAVLHFATQLPEEFLHMTDKFSMAHSIEARTPLLDHKLVEAVMSISARVRTHPYSKKYLFAKAMNNLLSQEVLNAPKKGFVLPLDRWLRGPLKDRLQYYLGEKYIAKQGIFSKKLYSHMVKPYLRGRHYLKNCIWTLFMFQLWHKRFICNGQ